MPCREGAAQGVRIATAGDGGHRLRNDTWRGYGGRQRKKQNRPRRFAKDDALHRDTTLLYRPLARAGLMKCRYTSALLRAPPSEPKAHAALGPAAPEPCSPIRSAPAFTWPGSLWWSKMGYSFLHCLYDPAENSFGIFGFCFFSLCHYTLYYSPWAFLSIIFVGFWAGVCYNGKNEAGRSDP